jgi:hypothetical protein
LGCLAFLLAFVTTNQNKNFHLLNFFIEKTKNDGEPSGEHARRRNQPHAEQKIKYGIDKKFG